MITIKEALKIIKNSITPMDETLLPITSALGHILSENLNAPINMPPFNQSAMDGYAIHYSENFTTYELIGEVAAGNSGEIELQAGQAVRIFTGARVPETANSVIQQEWVEQDGNNITFDRNVKAGMNIRPLGEQVKKGADALMKGTALNPAAIGYLATLGFAEVPVIKKPKIKIITTGNELVQPGQELPIGKIYESNSSMLAAALTSVNFPDFEVSSLKDNYSSTVEGLKTAIQNYDVLLVTGGISVGDYDFVGKALNEIGVNQHFHKVRQKPGKPLYFGSTNETYIFGLPGNPAAALSCFYVYVYAALNKLSGKGFKSLPTKKAQITSDFFKKGERAQFLKAVTSGKNVEILGSQSSAMLNTFAKANSLAYIEADKTNISKGEEVNVYLLPQL